MRSIDRVGESRARQGANRLALFVAAHFPTLAAARPVPPHEGEGGR